MTISRPVKRLKVLEIRDWRLRDFISTPIGLGHITQFLFVGMALADNLIQIADSTFFGIMYAAIRLRVGSIWPLIIIHMLGNTFTFIGGISAPNAVYAPPIGLFVVMWVVMIAYAIYLLSKPIVVTISDETPISESEPVPMIKPA
ncbi:MAG: CPBP family intramembrane glutamic endopeptidase [Anaerolineae bacterium]|nr:CPBP family intramembrane glutamic endopeptidase [Anaerolineae bacterium]